MRYLVTKQWLDSVQSIQAEVEPGKWAPAAPYRADSLWSRLRDCWEVLRCRADVIQWTDDVVRERRRAERRKG